MLKILKEKISLTADVFPKLLTAKSAVLKWLKSPLSEHLWTVTKTTQICTEVVSSCFFIILKELQFKKFCLIRI